MLCAQQDTTWFLAAHVAAFTHFAGVIAAVAYDNLSAAVAKVLVGAPRVVRPQFAALTAHYAFEARFCRPGEGHDKGGVESRGGHVRWQHMVPIPRGQTLAEMSAALQARLDAHSTPAIRCRPSVVARARGPSALACVRSPPSSSHSSARPGPTSGTRSAPATRPTKSKPREGSLPGSREPSAKALALASRDASPRRSSMGSSFPHPGALSPTRRSPTCHWPFSVTWSRPPT